MKTKQQIVESIHEVLSKKMGHPYLSTFHTDARLREDLALDSSATLQLLVFLELEYGLGIPEEALMNQDFDTVRSVAQLLHQTQARTSPSRVLDYEEDLKLHCFVSCLSEVIKRREDLEHRVFYFGVWDSEIVVSDRSVLSYHSETISHQFFIDWYRQLYGIEVRSWYDPALSKEENATRLVSLVEGRAPDQHIMVMLDMFLLPERVNEFNKDPFPHYLMLGPTSNPEEWFVYDPDYRWEGILKKERILAAMRQPSVAGGYLFSDRGAQAPQLRQIRAYFEASFSLADNPLTSAIRGVLLAHVEGRDRLGRAISLKDLGSALDEIPILSIRKYAYEHGLAFFWRELDLTEEEFDSWCEVIADLVKTYKLVKFQAMKVAATGSLELVDKIHALLNEQDHRETRIKKRLQEVYVEWRDRAFPREVARVSAGALS